MRMSWTTAFALAAAAALLTSQTACDSSSEKSSGEAPAVETPQTPEAYVELAAKLRREGKKAEAADTALKAYVLARTGTRVAERLELAKSYGAAGTDKLTMGAINEIKDLEREKNNGLEVDEVAIAEVYAQIGDPNAVFRWLGRAVEKKSPKLADIANNPDLEPVKQDPRWEQFLATIPK